MDPTPLILDAALLAPLRDSARNSPRRRMNLNLHASPEAACQRFFNALEADSYVPPHRHLESGKEETLVLVQGGLGLFFFDDSGAVTACHRLQAGSDRFGVHVPLGQWHCVLALDEGCVFLETKGGPFVPQTAGEFAPWAPAPGDPAANAYMAGLRRLIPAR